ncbi:DUF1217 domain-containing protein [Arenibacterium sp. CAU 1754]
MSFAPVVPSPGLAGWTFLQRTYDTQFEAFNKSPLLQRDSDYFLENIGQVKTAEDLVSDRRLLSVALGAFGLQDDINNRYFIRKILEDGTTSDDALANKLADNRYKKLSEAFRFGPGEIPNTSLTSKMQELVGLNRIQSFEIAVGEQDDTMRIALFAQRELSDLAQKDMNEDAMWFSVMGLKPLRTMFETALGLPSAFGQIDIDKQLEVFRERTRSVTGNASIKQFSDPEALERMTNLFLARSQIQSLNTANSSSANALALLQGAV